MTCHEKKVEQFSPYNNILVIQKTLMSLQTVQLRILERTLVLIVIIDIHFNLINTTSYNMFKTSNCILVSIVCVKMHLSNSCNTRHRTHRKIKKTEHHNQQHVEQGPNIESQVDNYINSRSRNPRFKIWKQAMAIIQDL